MNGWNSSKRQPSCLSLDTPMSSNSMALSVMNNRCKNRLTLTLNSLSSNSIVPWDTFSFISSKSVYARHWTPKERRSSSSFTGNETRVRSNITNTAPLVDLAAEHVSHCTCIQSRGTGLSTDTKDTAKLFTANSSGTAILVSKKLCSSWHCSKECTGFW